MADVDEFKSKKKEFKQKSNETSDLFDEFDESRDVGTSFKT